MNAFALLGMVFFTIGLAYVSIWFYGLVFMSVAFAGWDSLKDGWPWLLAWTLGTVVGWIIWWHTIGSHVNLNWG